MLVSHRHRFIALKTRKTAGTTVEIFLQPWCLPAGMVLDARAPAVVTEAGIVGARGGRRPEDAWYNHMPAATVRAQLGTALWDGYLKFCVVRHPLDRAVSWFWFCLDAAEAEALAVAPMATVRARMQDLLAGRPLPDDAAIYGIDGRFALDLVLRYETLQDDLGRLCARLGLPFEPARMGRYKGNFRRRPEPWQDYYDPAARAAALQRHAAECALFGYG